MTKPRIVQFACPAALVDRIDQIAHDEMLPRASVIRRALQWEVRAAGDPQAVAGAPAVGSHPV